QPRVIPPPVELDRLGPLVVVDGDCAYFKDGRTSRTAFALPGELDGRGYQRAMELGMRRSGTIVYRPLCEGCRRCQPIRVVVDGESWVRRRSRALDDEGVRQVLSRCEQKAQAADEKRFRLDRSKDLQVTTEE